MLIDNFAIARGDDAAGSPGAASLRGTSAALSAAESVGIVGGHPAPAPAAADPGPDCPDTDDESPLSGRSERQLASLGLGEATVGRFVHDYLQMLDGRLDSIRRCLDDSDIEGARVAVLSLESSSTMLGGDQLAARLAELRHQLDLGSISQRNALMALVESSAAAFRRHLESLEGT